MRHAHCISLGLVCSIMSASLVLEVKVTETHFLSQCSQSVLTVFCPTAPNHGQTAFHWIEPSSKECQSSQVGCHCRETSACEKNHRLEPCTKLRSGHTWLMLYTRGKYACGCVCVVVAKFLRVNVQGRLDVFCYVD